MTVKWHQTEVSLAERRRPAMWANEQEAAVLSGVFISTWYEKIASWEARGFPQKTLKTASEPFPPSLRFGATGGRAP